MSKLSLWPRTVTLLLCLTVAACAPMATPSPQEPSLTPSLTVTSSPRPPTVAATATSTPTATAPMIEFSVGDKEVIYSHRNRGTRNLYYWPDGNIGVIRYEDGYTFIAANSIRSARTTGQLHDIAQVVNNSSITIRGLKKNYNYAAGGPLYYDHASGVLLLFYHSELHPQGDYRRFYSSIGMAFSVDNGHTFTDLGEIVSAETVYDDPDTSQVVEMTGGTFAIKDGRFYIYFRDYLSLGAQNNLAVASAPVGEVIENAIQLTAANWQKYYEGSFSEPGLGGKSSQLESSNPNTRWMSVSYNTYLDAFVMVVAHTAHGNTNLYITASRDGFHWAPRLQIESESGESFYPTIIGIGGDPLYSEESFYVYYTRSVEGEFDRWNDAELVRRLITLQN